MPLVVCRPPGKSTTRFWVELAEDSSPSVTRGEGGTTVTLGKVLLESEVTGSAGVVIKVGIRSASCFESKLFLIVDAGVRALTDADGVAAVEWTLLRGFGDTFDSNDRSRL